MGCVCNARADIQQNPSPVDVELLCQLTCQLWDDDYQYNDGAAFDEVRHKIFLSHLDTIRAASIQKIRNPIPKATVNASAIDGTVLFPKVSSEPKLFPPRTSRQSASVRLPDLHQSGSSLKKPFRVTKQISDAPVSSEEVVEKGRRKEKGKDEDTLEKLLNKSQHERTGPDMRAVAHIVKDFAAFQHLSNFVLTQLCGVFHLNFFEKNRIVFKQGEPGTSWFVVYGGRVQVMVSDSSYEESVAVGEIGEGEGFGELALVNDKPRAATILTLTSVKLLRVEKSDYLRILRSVHAATLKERCLVLKHFPILSGTEKGILEGIANVCTESRYPPGSTLINEGDRMQDIMFLKRGQAVVEATLVIEGKRITVPIGNLSVGDYFGEALVIQWQTGSSIILSPVTVRCKTIVDAFVLNRQTARAKLFSLLRPTQHWEIATCHSELEKAWQQLQDRKLWKAYKRKLVKDFMREVEIRG